MQTKEGNEGYFHSIRALFAVYLVQLDNNKLIFPLLWLTVCNYFDFCFRTLYRKALCWKTFWSPKWVTFEKESTVFCFTYIHFSQIQKTFITDSQYTNKTKPLVDLNAFLTIAALSWKNQTSFSFNRVSPIHSKSFRLPFMYCWFCKQYRGWELSNFTILTPR